MKIKFNKIYAIITLLLFIIEALIAILLKTGFVRHTVGDFLCVILIFCFFKSFLKIDTLRLGIAVLIFAYCIEFLQLINILDLLNLEDHQILKVIVGTTFEVSDLVSYTLGIIAILVIDFKTKKATLYK